MLVFEFSCFRDVYLLYIYGVTGRVTGLPGSEICDFLFEVRRELAPTNPCKNCDVPSSPALRLPACWSMIPEYVMTLLAMRRNPSFNLAITTIILAAGS